MSHLVLKANRKPLVLDEDFQLQVEDPNPLFNDRSMYSYPVTIPLDGNRHYVRNIEDHQSDDRPVDLEHADMQIEVEGIPFRHGTAIISEDEHLTNRLSLNIDANEVSFSDLIADLNCRDVRVKDDITIGYKLSKVQVEAECTVNIVRHVLWWMPQSSSYDPAQHNGMTGKMESKISSHISASFEPQALGFSVPDDITAVYTERIYDKDIKVKVPTKTRKFINISTPYGQIDERTRKPAYYCNARVCYKHYAKDSEGKTADYMVEKKDSQNLYEDIYPYWVLDADRSQSGICFYILYFLECLFKQIGYSYNIDELKDIADFKRLCFFTTRCKYDIHENDPRSFPLDSLEAINAFLVNTGAGGEIQVTAPEESRNLDTVTIAGKTYQVGKTYQEQGDAVPGKYYTIEIKSIDSTTKVDSATAKAIVTPMYANSDNFPDMSVTSLLSSLENQFGIKLLVDEDKHHVHCTLLRSVFRDPSEPINLPMQIDNIAKISEKITGVKVGYSAESDAKEQQNNIKYGVRDYDTAYDYAEYPEPPRTVFREGLYKDIFRSPANNDMRVYIDLSTGNRYRVKVNSEANVVSELHPVLTEADQFGHVEFGDCREINEDYIRELRSDLTPVPLNDVNYYNELSVAEGTYKDVTITNTFVNGKTEVIKGNFSAEAPIPSPILVPFYDGDMEHEFIEQRINNVISEGLADAYITTILRTQESYDPTKTDDGNSPLQGDIWGNAIAIMRGGDPDKDGIVLYDANYDLFGNSKWRGSVRDYQISTDSVSQFGQLYEYAGEQFSLKPRAYASPAWYHPDAATLPNTESAEFGGQPMVVTEDKIRNRGYADRFLREYVHFLLKRKHFVIEGKMEPALLADIPNHWTRRFKIGTLIGYIDRITYNIDVRTGIRKCQLYFYTI